MYSRLQQSTIGTSAKEIEELLFEWQRDGLPSDDKFFRVKSLKSRYYRPHYRPIINNCRVFRNINPPERKQRQLAGEGFSKTGGADLARALVSSGCRSKSLLSSISILYPNLSCRPLNRTKSERMKWRTLETGDGLEGQNVGTKFVGVLLHPATTKHFHGPYLRCYVIN